MYGRAKLDLLHARLKAAVGTTSSDFVNATLIQIQNASRMPSGGISETSVNAVIARRREISALIHFGRALESNKQ